MLLDVRNHYESRIGYFVDPQTGEAALRPPIRRFSQWPQYLAQHKDIPKGAQGKQIMTYCTGGIRCEKGVRWMHENLEHEPGEKIYTLRGGIAAYLTWMDEEIQQGRKQISDSLFRGRNYVFDARGSMGLSIPTEPVSTCHVCSVATDSLSKCRSNGCHLVLVVCSRCDWGDPRCCQSCHEIDAADLAGISPEAKSPRPICACEQAREECLWGGDRVKAPKMQGWKKEKRKLLEQKNAINVQVEVIDQ